MPPRPSALRRLNATSGGGGSSALVSPTSEESFWQAVGDSEVFAAPLGLVVASVPVGTVVREVARFVDPFDDNWMATTDADGETVWFRELEELTLDGDEIERDAEWVKAVSADQERAPVAAPAAAPSTVSSRSIPSITGASSEISLFEYFWAVVSSEGSHRDWNAEYQLAAEDVMFSAEGADIDALREVLQGVVQEFAAHVGESVTSILTQMFSSKAAKSSVVRHPTEAGVFYFNGTLFCIAIDTGKCGGDDGAMKVASQHAKNLQVFSQVAPRYMLAVPMSLCMSFGGYRIQAFSIPPIGSASSKVKATDRSFVGAMVQALGSELNLSPFELDGSVTLSPSFTIVSGHDCRLYIFGLTDASPPIAPPMKRASYNPATTSRYWRLRREVIEQSPSSLSTAAFQRNLASDGDNEAAVQMTRWIRCVGLQTSAAVFGLMEPCAVAGMEGIQCSGCQKEVEDELRFGVCTNGCCYICAQCNIHAYEHVNVRKDSKACQELLSAAVKCGGSALNLRSLRISPDVTTLVHHYGVNMRLLHAVYSLIPRSAKGITGYHLEIEMVARAAKTVLFRRLRRGATCVEDIGSICANFFMALMQPGGELAEAFWSQELGPTIQELFDVFIPFDTEALDIERVCQRVSELTGVVLTEESMKSFAKLQTGLNSASETEEPSKPHVPTPPRRGKPGKEPAAAAAPASSSTLVPALSETERSNVGDAAFIQIAAINPTMKNVSIPVFCEVAGGRREFLHDHISALLLLWAGQMDGCREQYVMFESVHPKYLGEVAK